ncbi:MAG: bis(5'-nucleosyl)-tetraphosphatase (symmetrical) YqeK [Anaeroplasmataceae bacterium]
MQLSENDVKRVFEIVNNKYKDNHKNRFAHIIGVYNMALRLADIYNVSRIKAGIAALIHDYYKYETFEEMDDYLTNGAEKEECRKYPFLYHAYCSAKALHDVFEIDDDSIFNAIHNHVFGRVNMSDLEKIIMISDYTEENRKYEDCIRCREILFDKGIDEAIYFSTLKTIEHVKKNGDTVHPTQLLILKEYEEKCYAKNNN